VRPKHTVELTPQQLLCLTGLTVIIKRNVTGLLLRFWRRRMLQMAVGAGRLINVGA